MNVKMIMIKIKSKDKNGPIAISQMLPIIPFNFYREQITSNISSYIIQYQNYSVKIV